MRIAIGQYINKYIYLNPPVSYLKYPVHCAATSKQTAISIDSRCYLNLHRIFT